MFSKNSDYWIIGFVPCSVLDYGSTGRADGELPIAAVKPISSVTAKLGLFDLAPSLAYMCRLKPIQPFPFLHLLVSAMHHKSVADLKFIAAPDEPLEYQILHQIWKVDVTQLSNGLG